MTNTSIDPGKYGIFIRILDGYVMASSVEFQITVTKPFNEIKKSEEIGKLYFDLVEKISTEIKSKLSQKTKIPEPRSPVAIMKDLPSPLLTTKEVAKQLEISVSSVIRLCDTKKLKFSLTTGGHRKFKFQDILDFKEKLQT